MLKKLKRIEMKLYWIDEKGDKHEGCPSGLRGDVSGLRGDVSGISGDVNKCSITDKERNDGININDLVSPE